MQLHYIAHYPRVFKGPRPLYYYTRYCVRSEPPDIRIHLTTIDTKAGRGPYNIYLLFVVVVVVIYDIHLTHTRTYYYYFYLRPSCAAPNGAVVIAAVGSRRFFDRPGGVLNEKSAHDL